MLHHYAIEGLHINQPFSVSDLPKELSVAFAVDQGLIGECRVTRASLDARRKPYIRQRLNLEIALQGRLDPLPPGWSEIAAFSLPEQLPSFRLAKRPPGRVVVVGAGPAGLFASLMLAEAGMSVCLLERGREVEPRMRDIGRLRSFGELQEESNICFGEGGAGTYTDGKLYTRIRHPWADAVLARMVQLGAPPEIAVQAHPHLGTDRLKALILNLRAHLQALGVEMRFASRCDGLLLRNGRAVGVVLATGEEIPAECVFLAVGHSARDTLSTLYGQGVAMEGKSFAIGVRVEHPQVLINEAQLGMRSRKPIWGAAEYRLSHEVAGRGVYSFCMCPGGLIVPAPTEAGHMVVNGMSNSNRSSAFANSGIVVQVHPEDLQRMGLGEGPLAGMALQRQIEAACFAATAQPYRAPACRIVEFLQKRGSGSLAPTHFRPGAEWAPVWQLLPPWIVEPLRTAMRAFDGKLRGFVSEEANLFSPESRTSSPLRLPRAENFCSINTPGLYPIGEGAGYAGGIVSAAVDGLRAAAALLSSLDLPHQA